MSAGMLARIQFAFTIGYHFLFVPISVGLGVDAVIAERRYYKSGLAGDKATSEFWMKLFAATFAIGVATGITMEFAFGTNWANYSRFVGDIFGAPLAAEGLFAFFLESIFLGVLLFGRKRVSKRLLLRLDLAGRASAPTSRRSGSSSPTRGCRRRPATSRSRSGDSARPRPTSSPRSFNPSTLPRFFHTVVALPG